PTAAAKPTEAAKPVEAKPAVQATEPAKPAAARGGGTFKLPVNANITPWPPIGAVQNLMVNKTVFSQLVKYNKTDFTPTADLAETWSAAPDGLSWTFNLRKGVTWHDGRPFTADDVKFTLELYKDPKVNSILRSGLAPIDRIETPDPNTVVVGTSEKFSSLPELLCYLCFMLPKHLLDGQDLSKPPDEFINKPIGTGAFKFVEHVRGDHFTVAANESFYFGKPMLEGVIYKVIPDVNTTVAQVRTGELDIAFIGVSALDALKGANNVRIDEANQMDMRHIGGNYKHPRVGKWFSDPRVRHAVSYAIDRKQIMEAVTDNRAYPIVGPIPPFLSTWVNKNLQPWEHDPEKARSLLREVGFKPGSGGILELDGEPFRFTMSSDKGQPDREQTGLIVQQNLKDVGVDVQLELLDFNSYMGKWRSSREFEAVNWYYVTPSTPDLTAYWSSGGSTNEWGYSNPEVDKLFQEARTVFEQDKRKAVYDKVQELLHQDQPVAFLYTPKELRAINARIKGFPSLGYRDALQWMHEVSVE
ncbi:MAG: ABC transporter substrate-binding protein, partial [Chloroflexi bacterium]|nr:ABC transporter substrate-binding protein [Chloroflexota bacterium]